MGFLRQHLYIADRLTQKVQKIIGHFVLTLNDALSENSLQKHVK